MVLVCEARRDSQGDAGSVNASVVIDFLDISDYSSYDL